MSENKASITISSNATKTPETHAEIQALHLRSYPAMALCPQCNKAGFSAAERSINWLNCLFCCCCNACWWCYMNYKWRDINCYDVSHNCSSCKAKLADYRSC